MSESKKNKDDVASAWPTTQGEDATKLWAGYGSGMPCVHCGKPITSQEFEYEIANPTPAPQGHLGAATPMKFHLDCLDEWRRRRSGST